MEDYGRPDDGLGHYVDCGNACPCYKAGFNRRSDEIAELRREVASLRDDVGCLGVDLDRIGSASDDPRPIKQGV